MAPRAITVIAYTLLPFVSPYRYRRNRSWIFSRPFYCYGPCLCRCPDHLLCKQAEIQSKSLFWLRFRISDEAKYVPKMFLLRSEEHTSELQSQSNLVCRLLLEKTK